MNNQANSKLYLRRDALRVVFGACSTLALGVSLPMELWAASSTIKSTAAPASTPQPPSKPRPPRILMVDPGHGGRDPGALGKKYGTREKDVTLDIARHLADALSANPGMTAKLTRDSDEFVPLEERAKMGRDAGADLFLSVHADSAPSAAAHGLSVYTLSEKASDEFSKLLADQENRADLVGGLDLPPADKDVTAILFDLATRRTRNVAQHARSSLVQSVGKNWPLLESPMRSANFAVLRTPDIPSMLVETGFLSNPRDEKMLADPRQRERIARLMAKEIASLFKGALFG